MAIELRNTLDQSLDFGENEAINIDFATNEISDIATRFGVQSASFDVALTQNNIKWLGLYSAINSNVNRKISCRLFQNGTQLAEGFVQIQSVNLRNNTASLNFFGGNVEWFELVKLLKLNDLDLSALDHVYNVANVISSFANTTGYIYPFIDYGRWFNIAPTQSPPNLELLTDLEDWFPAVYVSTIVSAIEKEINYTFVGSFINSTAFNRLVIPFSPKSKYIFSEEFATSRQATATGSGFYSGAGGLQIFDFDAVTQGADECFSIVNDRYTANIAGMYTFVVTAATTLTGDLILLTTSGSYTTSLFNGTLTQSVYMEVGDIARVAVEPNPLEPSTPVGMTFEISFSRTGLVEDGLVQVSQYLPEMTASDLLKFLAISFNLIFQVNSYNKQINVFTLEDVQANLPNALDWTSKQDQTANELDYLELVQNYAQNNYFRYKENDKDSEAVSYNAANLLPYGDGDLVLENDFLDTENELYTAPFAATPNTESFQTSVYLPQITMWNGTDYVSDPLPRIGFIVDKNASISALVNGFIGSSYYGIRINGGSFEQVAPMFSFFKRETGNTNIDTFKESLAFDTPNISLPNDTPLFEKYYVTLERILNETKYVKVLLRLNEIDIHNLDFSKPVYLGYPYFSYFFISKIKEYNPNELLTECELVKL